ncbi:MAG: hypothetical protein O3A00_24970 [Planctomycetota bacterium]|nr:hypothetical protein [Planctomycetota bacterium]
MMRLAPLPLVCLGLLGGCAAFQLATGMIEVGTVELADVRIKVLDIERGSTGTLGEGYVQYNKDTSTFDSRPSVTFADLKIEIAVTGNTRSLIVNGHDYGEVKRGDRVVVNEKRGVLVNGTTRKSPIRNPLASRVGAEK